VELGKLRRRHRDLPLAGDGAAMDGFVPVSRPYIWGDEKLKLCQAIDGGWVSSRGPFLDEFEDRFAEKIGTRYAVAASSGTAAIHLALSVLDLENDDEVIVPDFTMISPVLAVLACRAIPVPVDADATWNMDPDRIERAITDRTRAIVVVHTYGHPARIDRIMEIARQHNLRVVEDAAESLGARVAGQPVGSFGDLAIFSFYANKVLTTGEGGMVVTSDSELCERLRSKRNLCFGADEETRFIHDDIGFNYRMTNLQAAVGLAQLHHLDEAVEAKIAIAREYTARLRNISGITIPPDSNWGPNIYWVYGVLIEDEFGLDRKTVQAELKRNGIETRRFFHPLHRQPIIPKAGIRDEFPNSAMISERGLYLPSFIGMGTSTIERVVDCLTGLRV
jgi:perosamine synthetase